MVKFCAATRNGRIAIALDLGLCGGRQMQGRVVRRNGEARIAQLLWNQDAISIRDKASSWPSLDVSREAQTVNLNLSLILNLY